MRIVLYSLAAIAGLCGCVSTPALAQDRSAVKQGFELPTHSNKRILVFRPTVSVGGQSMAGLFEPNSDWTEKAKVNIQRALEVRQAELGNTIIMAPDAYGDEARDLQEHMALFAAVSQAVIEYQFFTGNRLPTKKRDNKAQIFDWSLGQGVAKLPGAQDADYGLFIYDKDAYGSTGRKVLQVFAAMGGVSVISGEHKGYAGLVDLRTGDLLWLNADVEMGGDVRETEGAKKRVGQLLRKFPGSQVVDEPKP